MSTLRKRRKTHRFLIMLAASLLLTGGLSTGVYAKKIGEIKGTNVNVRASAGVEGAKVTTLNSADQVILVGRKKDSAGKLWYKATFIKNGQEYTGYIISDYVTEKESVTTTQTPAKTETQVETQPQAETETASATTKTKATVTASNVNVRKSAVTGAVVGKVTLSDSVTITKEKKGSDGQTWYYITFRVNGKNQKGWIRNDFVKKSDDQQTQNTTQANTQENTNTEQPAQSTQTTTTKAKATVSASNVNVRKSAVTGAVVGRVTNGNSVTIKKQKTASDGKVWYYISFKVNGKSQKGWIRNDFVKIKEQGQTENAPQVEPQENTEPQAGENTPSEETENIDTSNSDSKPGLTKKQFEAFLEKQKFPEDYKEKLRQLHASYPNWTFMGVPTNLRWEDALNAESKTGLNLVAKTSIASWKSTESTAYNYKTNTWYGFDGGSWASASRELVAYYMDPRNFLGEESIFQFESLEYEPYQTEEGLKALLASTFMKGSYTEPDGSKGDYAKTFLQVGKQVGLNPYHLATRCYQEQGKGTSDSISGKVKGYENFFNYYNIGAYATGNNSPTRQGLIYASSSAAGATNYERPWNSRYKSILGGAQYVAQKYVKVGQNTLYFQKFNVVNSKNGIYRHQYMGNIQAAASEGLKMSKAYRNKNSELVFYIPIYTDMPQTPCEKPTSDANPNAYLSALVVDGYAITPAFDPAIDTYTLTIPKKYKKVTIGATPVASTSTVEGSLGTVKVKKKKNELTFTCKAQNGNMKTYTLVITRE